MRAYIISLTALFILFFYACVGQSKTNQIEHNIQQSKELRYVKHTYNNFPSAFLSIESEEVVEVFSRPLGDEKIKEIKNNIEEEDFVMLDLLQKQDSMYYVIAYSGLTDEVFAIGWISQNTNLGVYSSAYGDLHCSLYQMPFNRKQVIITEKVYNPSIYEILDFDGGWLKVRVKIDDKFYIGWLPPEMQCPNPYTTCS